MNRPFEFARLYRSALRRLRQRSLDPMSRYWDARYETGGDSGPGSFGKLAKYKADFLNSFVAEHAIGSVIEFGCGDGNQLALYEFPEYVGLDVSPIAISMCRERFRSDNTKRFERYKNRLGFCLDNNMSAELTISIDVIFHLTDDNTYSTYLAELFSASRRYAIIYASNCNAPPPAPHVRHRLFADDVEIRFPEWELVLVEPNPYPFEGDAATGSFSDFHVFRLRAAGRTR